MKYDLKDPKDVEAFKNYANHVVKNKKCVELKQIRPPRSLDQNNYFHVVATLFGLGYGYSIQEAKTHLKRKYGLVYEVKGEKFLVSTADMDTKELTDFIEWCRTYSAKHGNYIPTAMEYLTNKFKIDQEIENNREHLK